MNIIPMLAAIIDVNMNTKPVKHFNRRRIFGLTYFDWAIQSKTTSIRKHIIGKKHIKIMDVNNLNTKLVF